jgi:hypothetical protein
MERRYVAGEEIMIINKGGVLSEEYFTSYLKLVKNSLNCSNNEAYNITFSRLFKNNPEILGKESYNSFQNAYKKLSLR